MDICEFPGCCENAEESHHILEQCESDKYKNVSGINMNKKSNLVALCKKHHNEITYKNLFIKGYKETDKGLKLDYIYKDKKIKKNKFSDDDIVKIKEYSNSHSGLPKNSILALLEKNENIKISITSYNKILKGDY